MASTQYGSTPRRICATWFAASPATMQHMVVTRPPRCPQRPRKGGNSAGQLANGCCRTRRRLMPAMTARRPPARLSAVTAAARGPGGAGRGRPSPAGPDDPATAGVAVIVTGDWQGRGVGALPGPALTKRRPAAVSRLRTVVEAACERSISAGLVPPAAGADVLPLTPHT